jgi:hypothetical protein
MVFTFVEREEEANDALINLRRQAAQKQLQIIFVSGIRRDENGLLTYLEGVKSNITAPALHSRWQLELICLTSWTLISLNTT